jgi:hypothetical protein
MIKRFFCTLNNVFKAIEPENRGIKQIEVLEFKYRNGTNREQYQRVLPLVLFIVRVIYKKIFTTKLEKIPF